MVVFIGCENQLTFDKAMMKAASELNESCPIMVDQDTRLDNAIAQVDNSFQYNYTLVNLTKTDIEIDGFTAFLEEQITTDVRTNPDLKIYRDNKVTMMYSYKDKNGEFVTKIVVTPEEYQ
jgi:hypothetical protein